MIHENITQTGRITKKQGLVQNRTSLKRMKVVVPPVCGKVALATKKRIVKTSRVHTLHRKSLADARRQDANQLRERYPISTIQENPVVESAVDAQHCCVFRKEICDYVYVPVGYGEKFLEANQGCAPPAFCRQCRLQPCMNLEYKDEIYGYGHRLVDHNNPAQREYMASAVNEAVVSRLFDSVVQRLMRELFGREYQEKKGVPRCVWDMVHKTFPGDSEYWYDSSDSEDGDDVLSLPKNHYY